MKNEDLIMKTGVTENFTNAILYPSKTALSYRL